jgi:hypothetical protein
MPRGAEAAAIGAGAGARTVTVRATERKDLRGNWCVDHHLFDNRLHGRNVGQCFLD